VSRVREEGVIERKTVSAGRVVSQFLKLWCESRSYCTIRDSTGIILARDCAGDEEGCWLHHSTKAPAGDSWLDMEVV
jgi:hypothetical protein